jgi:hypothetical protein
LGGVVLSEKVPRDMEHDCSHGAYSRSFEKGQRRKRAENAGQQAAG